MKKVFLTGFLLHLIVSGFSQHPVLDSSYVRTFGPVNYRSSEINYAATEDENGIMFFANENGLLEYDGSHWRLHPLPDYSYINVVEYGPDGKFYLGGRNEFGYMERDSVGNMIYRSMREMLDSTVVLKECWQIVFHKGDVLFQTYEGIVKWDGELSKILPITDAWFFPHGDEMYVSVIEKGLGIFQGDSVNFLNTDLKLENDNPLALLPYNDNEKILPTEYNGLFLIDMETFKTRKWEVDANKTFLDKGIWLADTWDDSTYIFSLINGGIRWVNKSGKIIKSLSEDDGFRPEELHDFFRDTRQNLWLSGYGVHHLVWPHQQNLDAGRTLIGRIVVDGNEQLINRANSHLDIQDYEPLKDLVIYYSTPGFDAIDLEFSTNLTGYDSDWSPWTRQALKEYTNLQGGHYSFTVKSRIPGGAEFPSATLSFFVPTPWYNAGWAKLVGGMLIWAMVIGLYKVRTMQLRQKNKNLEETVAERTAELHKTNDLLATKNYELDQFVRRVSHDLVAPMKSARALMDLSREENDPAEKEKCLDMIELSLDKQQQFVHRMLDQAVNYREVKVREVNLAIVCGDILSHMSHFEGFKAVKIELDFDETFTFHSDPDRVKIVLSNLITNAIKYRNLSEPEPRIKINAARTDGYTKVSIADNGMGIAKEELANIFEMFKRATLQAHGSGLGLYISRDMMNKLDGYIEVESELNVGTTFHLFFPDTCRS